MRARSATEACSRFMFELIELHPLADLNFDL